MLDKKLCVTRHRETLQSKSCEWVRMEQYSLSTPQREYFILNVLILFAISKFVHQNVGGIISNSFKYEK